MADLHLTVDTSTDAERAAVDAALQACKARKAFDLANRAGARLVAFVAPDEWDVGKVRVKDISFLGASASRSDPRHL